MTDPREEMQQMITDARKSFDASVFEFLQEGTRLAASLSAAIGEVSAQQALEAWKTEMVKRLRQP
jgi:hypothetical protein